MSDKYGSILYVRDAYPKPIEMKAMVIENVSDFLSYIQFQEGGFNSALLWTIPRGSGTSQREGSQIYVHRVVVKSQVTHRAGADAKGWEPYKFPVDWIQELVLDTRSPKDAPGGALDMKRMYQAPRDADNRVMWPLAIEDNFSAPDRYYSLLREQFQTRLLGESGTIGTQVGITVPIEADVTTTVGTEDVTGIFRSGLVSTREYEFEFRKPMLVKYDDLEPGSYGAPADRELYFNTCYYQHSETADYEYNAERWIHYSVAIYFTDHPGTVEEAKGVPGAVIDEDVWVEENLDGEANYGHWRTPDEGPPSRTRGHKRGHKNWRYKRSNRDYNSRRKLY